MLRVAPVVNSAELIAAQASGASLSQWAAKVLCATNLGLQGTIKPTNHALWA
jgi:hypothetical protein